jgi:hypothetical protein
VVTLVSVVTVVSALTTGLLAETRKARHVKRPCRQRDVDQTESLRVGLQEAADTGCRLDAGAVLRGGLAGRRGDNGVAARIGGRRLGVEAGRHAGKIGAPRCLLCMPLEIVDGLLDLRPASWLAGELLLDGFDQAMFRGRVELETVVGLFGVV